MGEFRIFEFLDDALIKAEVGTPHASRTPAVWPSEASALRVDRSQWNIVGKCHLAAFYRMIGMPITNPPDAISAWKWIIGRSVEEHLTDQAKKAGVYVAEGVKHWIPDVGLSIEMDVISLDPATNDPYIVECKSFAGYFAAKEIMTENRPKLENLIQVAIYLVEARDGKHLKEIILKSLADRVVLDTKKADLADKGIEFNHRNRSKANLDVLSQMTDAPVKGKLVYVDRADAGRKEFTIEIFTDFDGSHYPMVDGVPFKVFTIESIYHRYKTLQTYWFAARAEAVRRLAEKGVKPPKGMPLVLDPRDVQENTEPRILTKAQRTSEEAYLRQLEEAVRALPPDPFFPKPEYEWSYSPERIDQLFEAKAIGKTKYTKYKKDQIQRIGDWQCLLPGTPIEMSDGTFKNIEHIERNNRTSCGKVTRTMSKPVDREVVAVKPYNLLEMMLTTDHKVKVGTGGFVTAGELTTFCGRTGRTRKGRIEGDELIVPFETTEQSTGLNPDELAIIGLWLAEGHLHMKNRAGTKYFKCGFTIHPNEQKAADLVHRWAATYVNRWNKPVTVTDRVKVDPRNGHRYRVLTVNSVEATAFILKWTQGHSAAEKAMVPAIRQASLVEQQYVLAWLKYGDGCTTRMRESEMHVVSSVSRQLALDVQRMLWRAGQIAGITVQAPQGMGKNPVYHVRWYNGSSVVSRIENGVFYTKVMRITRNMPYSGPVYDLTVAKTHEIPTASGIVHNCAYCSVLGHCLKRQKPELQFQVDDLLAFLNDASVEVEIG